MGLDFLGTLLWSRANDQALTSYDLTRRQCSRIELAPGRRRGQCLERVSVHQNPKLDLTKKDSPAGFKRWRGGADLIHLPGCVLASEE